MKNECLTASALRQRLNDHADRLDALFYALALRGAETGNLTSFWHTAVRSQSQFCRSAACLGHLKEAKKQSKKSSNELLEGRQ